jgi:hypothetical protein
MGLPETERKAIEEIMDTNPQTGDVAADYADAVAGRIAKLTAVREAVAEALASKTKAEGTYAWGESTTHPLPGDYSGKVTRVTDQEQFLEDNPAVQAALDQLDAAGVGGLLEHIDQIYVAEGKFDGNGALKFNGETGELELWLARDALSSDSKTAFTVRHELGHVADGAFGIEGYRAYADRLTPALMLEARALSEQDTDIGAALAYAFEQETVDRMEEELLAQLWAVATGRTGTSLLPKGLAKYITGVINDAKTNRNQNVANARAKAEQEYAALKADLEGSGGEVSTQGQLQQVVRKAGVQLVGGQRNALNDVLRSLNRTLNNVNPQSVINEHMDRAVAALEHVLPQVQAAITEAKRAMPQGLAQDKKDDFIKSFITRKLGSVPIGPMPHTLRFLGAPMQMVKVDTGILYKIFFNENKHAAEMANVTPEKLVSEIYEPTLVLKSKDGFDLVLNIQGEKGPLLVPVGLNREIDEKGGKVAAIATTFGKQLMGGPESIGSRILKGDVVYADTGMDGQSLRSGTLASQGGDTNLASSTTPGAREGGIVGTQGGLTKLQSVLGSSYKVLYPRIKAGLLDKTKNGVKTDDGRLAWIGGNFKPESSKEGWQDVPRFSKGGSWIEGLEGRAGPTAAMVSTDATHTAKKIGLSMMGLHDIVDMYKNTVPAIGKWYNEVRASVATRRQLEGDAEKIAVASEKLKHGSAKVNDFLSRSTFDQKWGYIPAWKADVKVDPVLKGMFDRLTDSEQEVVKAVFAHGEKMRKAKAEILKSLGIDQLFKLHGAMDGPYAPLKRFGNYVANLKSKELLAAEKAGNSEKVEELKKDPNHFVTSSFDTKGQAMRFAKANEAAFGWSDYFEKSERTQEGQGVPHKTMQEIMSALKLTDDVPAESKVALENMLRDMYLQTLDEHNARTSGLRRMNRAGYDADMMRSFLAHAKAESGFLSNMKHGGDINTAFIEMNRQAKDENTGKREHQDAVNVVAKHYADSLNYKETPIQDALMAGTSAWQLATSLGYHLTNMTQGFMVSLPKLASDFNDYSGAWRHLTKAYGMIKTVGTGDNMDLSRVKDAGLRGALQFAMDQGLLDLGMDTDMSRLEGMRTGLRAVDATTQTASMALNKLRKVSQTVEAWNRISAASAAYTMAVEKGKSVTEAQEYAVRMLESTQGDFSRMGSPLMLKKLPKLVTQYRKYQFMMGALYVKAFNQAFLSSNPTEKAIGRRMLAYKMFHTSMAAGVLGLPLMNLVSAVMGALGDDDEPPDMERDLRKWIGDDNLSNLLLHGLLNMIGLDMSSKLGDNNIFSIMPYGTVDLTSASGLAKTVAGLAGPAFSQAGKFADGVGMMQKGEYYKATEKFMPKGASDALKAFRVANEGYTLKNGDLMVRPDDINEMALALDALGLPSAKLKRMDWLRGQQYEIGVFYKERSRAIQSEYVRAVREQDTEGMGEARKQWMELQDGKDSVRFIFNDSNEDIKRQPLSTLLKAPQNNAKREQKLQRGVPETIG